MKKKTGIFICIVSFFLVFAFLSSGLSHITTVEASSNQDAQPIAEWGTGETVSISYSADGSLLAVATNAGYILVYETKNYTLLQKINTGMTLGYYDFVYEMWEEIGGVAISPDNRYVGAVAVDQSTGMWNIQTGDSVFINWGDEHGKHKSTSFATQFRAFFLGQGEIFAYETSQDDYSAISIFRSEDGTRIPIGGIPYGAYTDNSFTSDFRKTNSSVGGWNSSAKWVQEKTVDWLTWNGEQPINNISCMISGDSGDGKYVYSHHYPPYKSAVWDSSTGQMLFETYDDVNSWVKPNFSSDNQVLTITSAVNTSYQTTVWNLASGIKIGQFESPTYAPLYLYNISSIAIRPPSDQMAYPIAGGVEIVSLPSGELVKTILFNSCNGPLKLSPNKQLIASFFGRAIYVCQVTDGKLLRTIVSPTGTIRAIDWSPDSRYLVSSGSSKGLPDLPSGATPPYDTKLHIWDAETGEIVNTFDGGHEGNIEIVKYSPDGKLIVSIGMKGEPVCSLTHSGNEIVVRQASDGKIIANFKSLIKSTDEIIFTADNTSLLIGGMDACDSSAPHGLYKVDFRGWGQQIIDADGFFTLSTNKILTRNRISGKDEIWDISGTKPLLLNTLPSLNYPKSGIQDIIASWDYFNLVSDDETMMVAYHQDDAPMGSAGARSIYLATFNGDKHELLIEETAKYYLDYFSAAFIDDNNKVLISQYDELMGVIKVFSTSGIK